MVACGSPPAVTPAKVAHGVHTTANASDLGHFQRKTSTNAKRSPPKLGAGWLGGPGDYGGAALSQTTLQRGPMQACLSL